MRKIVGKNKEISYQRFSSGKRGSCHFSGIRGLGNQLNVRNRDERLFVVYYAA